MGLGSVQGAVAQKFSRLPWVQGFDPAELGFVEAGISAPQAGHMLGNAMSLNIVERVLARASWCTGLTSTMPKDRWEDMSVQVGPPMH